MKKKCSPETDIVHGVTACHCNTMDLVSPLHMTSTFKFRNVDHGAGIFAGTDSGYVYTRIANPTTDQFQEKMALLEGGAKALATATGMAAIAAMGLTLAKPGDNFVACSAVYGGTFKLFNRTFRQFSIEPRLLTPAESCQKAEVAKVIDSRTRFLFMETPSNPTLDIIDIELWAEAAHRSGIPLIVDNTFATPYLQNPLAWGADMVVHSATKYLGGHGDLLGGVIVGSEAWINRLKEDHAHHFGATLSPFNAWLLLRGMKTLALRMDRHCRNAVEISRWLDRHPKIEKVYYPGLPSHLNHTVAKRQMKQFGGMIAFEVAGGLEAGKKMINRLELCTLAVSLGDCDTLIQHPASMTHATYSPAERQKAGISEGLIRLSVGVESCDDLIADLERGLAAI